MNDTIRVGELVKIVPWKGFAKVLSLHTASTGKQWAWIEWEDGYCASVGAADLTRIEPEPGTLSLGQVVRRKRDADRTGVVTGLEARIRWGDCLYENVLIEVLEPVPEPCPECKGSGVASE